MLMDRDAASWRSGLAALKAEVGACVVTTGVVPVSAVEGRFAWTCEHGRVNGRVQRAPTREFLVQALEFNQAAP